MTYSTNCLFCGRHHTETKKLVVGAIASICRECVIVCGDLAEVPMVQAAGDPGTLGECPIGLFVSDDGEICVKTEYHTAKGAVEAYIVSSGEFFWGAPPQTVESQLQQLVHPVRVTTGEITDAR